MPVRRCCNQGGLIATVEVVLTFLLLSLLGFWLTKDLAHLVSGSQAILPPAITIGWCRFSATTKIAELASNFNHAWPAGAAEDAGLRASERIPCAVRAGGSGHGHIGVRDHCWLRASILKLAEILDCEPAAILGKSFTAMFQPADAAHRQANRTRLDSGERQVFENDVSCAAPTAHWSGQA